MALQSQLPEILKIPECIVLSQKLQDLHSPWFRTIFIFTYVPFLILDHCLLQKAIFHNLHSPLPPCLHLEGPVLIVSMVLTTVDCNQLV